MIASAICNDGVLCRPYIADHIENDTGTIVRRFDKQEYGKLLNKEDTQRIRSLMEAVTDYGTGSALSGRGYDVAGKTGSAEYNEDKDSHGWFVGYAQDGEKQIAIAVIVEDGGSGSSSAVPVAGEVFDAYFDE
jgi:peptidoglycan glycosyltransferase